MASGGNKDLDLANRSTIQTHNLIIQWANPKHDHAAQSTTKYSHRFQSLGGIIADAQCSVGKTGVNAMAQSREQEKKDMQDLNERLANYIDKVRFLEAQNRKLEDENQGLKKTRGEKDTSLIMDKIDNQLKKAIRECELATNEKSHLAVDVAKLQRCLDELQARLDAAEKEAARFKGEADRNRQQLSDYESELGLLRRRCTSADEEKGKGNDVNKELQAKLEAARSDVYKQTLLHIDADNRRQALEDELLFLKEIHEQNLSDLRALAYRNSTSENREYWNQEMGEALREIQQHFESKLESIREELESYYNLRVKELDNKNAKEAMEITYSKQECKRLREQLSALREIQNNDDGKKNGLEDKLREKEERARELEQLNGELTHTVIKVRAEMDAMSKEVQRILDSKIGLELEIAAYRSLMDGEDNRNGLRRAIDGMLQNDGSSTNHVTVRQTEETYGAKRK